MTVPKTLLLACAASAALLAAAVPSSARDLGIGSGGDAYLNDMVRNPRFIEPYADQLPSRYRAYDPRAGWDDRHAAARWPGYYRAPVGVPRYGY